MNERVDRRHVRRALTPDEFTRLLAAAERRPLDEKFKERVIKGVTPKERVRLLVHPRVAQALARHAKIETTMAVYTDLTSLDLRGAIERTGNAAEPRASTAVGG